MLTEAQMAQRRRNVKTMAENKRSRETCKRGHNNWRIKKDGARHCRTCDADQHYYAYRGFGFFRG